MLRSSCLKIFTDLKTEFIRWSKTLIFSKQIKVNDFGDFAQIITLDLCKMLKAKLKFYEKYIEK